MGDGEAVLLRSAPMTSSLVREVLDQVRAEFGPRFVPAPMTPSRSSPTADASSAHAAFSSFPATARGRASPWARWRSSPTACRSLPDAAGS